MKWIIAGVVVALLLGVGGFVLVNSGDDNEQSQVNESQIADESSPQVASINTLLASGQNQSCTYDFTDEDNNRFVGQAYFSGERLSGDFTNELADGQTFQSNAVRVGDTFYVWENSSTQGVQFDSSAYSNESSQELSERFDPDQEFEFDCQSWAVDESVFEIPSGVEFTNFSEQIEQVQQQLDSNASDICTQIEDPQARAVCEQAL